MDNFHFNFSSKPNGPSLIDDVIDFDNFGNYGLIDNASPSMNYDHMYHGLANMDHYRVNHGLASMDHHHMNHDLVSHVKQEPDFTNSMVVSTNTMTSNGHATQMNHGAVTHVKQDPDLLIPTGFYQNGWTAPPPPGFNNQLGLSRRMAQMRRDVFSSTPTRVQVESTIDYLPIPNRPDMTRVTMTETIRKQYVTTISTNNMISVQNDIERVRRALACESHLGNPTSNQTTPTFKIGNNHGVAYRGNHSEALDPKPLTICHSSSQDQISSRDKPCHVFLASSQGETSTLNKNHKYLDPKPLNIFPPPDRDRDPSQDEARRHRECSLEDIDNVVYLYDHFDEIDEDGDNDGGNDDDDKDDERHDYDGRTHSLPCEKYGPYTCPKCSMAFDTSQKFAAHMLAAHYRFETEKEKKRRLRARYKKRFRLLNNNIHRIEKWSERIETSHNEIDGQNMVQKQDGTLYDVVVKQEPV